MDPRLIGPIDEQLRLEPLATHTASYDTTALDLGAGFAPGDAGIPVTAVVNTSALVTGGDQTYTSKLQQMPTIRAGKTSGRPPP